MTRGERWPKPNVDGDQRGKVTGDKKQKTLLALLELLRQDKIELINFYFRLLNKYFWLEL